MTATTAAEITERASAVATRFVAKISRHRDFTPAEYAEAVTVTTSQVLDAMLVDIDRSSPALAYKLRSEIAASAS